MFCAKNVLKRNKCFQKKIVRKIKPLKYYKNICVKNVLKRLKIVLKFLVKFSAR